MTLTGSNLVDALLVGVVIVTPIVATARWMAWRKRKEWPNETWVDYLDSTLALYGLFIGCAVVAAALWIGSSF